MKKIGMAIFIMFFIFGLAGGEAKAYIVQYSINGLYNPPTTWLTADFKPFADDPGGLGRVLLTITGENLTGGIFLDQLGFNINPTYTSAVSITQYSATGTFGKITILPSDGYVQSQNSILNIAGSGDYGKFFDVLLDFPQNSAKNRFDGTDSVTFLLTGPGLTVDVFNATNKAYGIYPGAHIGAQLSNFPPVGNLNASYVTDVAMPAVPIPAAAWLLASGLIGLVVIRRRIKNENLPSSKRKRNVF